MEQLTPSVLLVAPDRAEEERMTAELKSFDLTIRSTTDGPTALEMFYIEPPRCLVLYHGMTMPGGRSILDEIKSDNVYGHLPVVLVVSEPERDAMLDWAAIPADDYVVQPYPAAELYSRIRMCLARASRDVNANPLTGLPGNLTIHREAERRLASGKPFCLAYLDVDHFKAFNDRYGFARGDEVLRMTARVLVNAIRSIDAEGSYVGHIGGDDFVFMTPPGSMQTVCKRVLEDFDRIVPNFYDEEDRTRGHIESVDRQGNPSSFPLMGCSIGVIDTSATTVSHIADLFSRVSEVKSFTKRIPGSSFIIDRRK